MKKLIYLMLGMLLFLLGCTKENVQQNNSAQGNLRPLAANESIIAKALLYTKWYPPSWIMNYDYLRLKIGLADAISKRCSNSFTSIYYEMSDDEIAWSALMHKFLVEAHIRTADELKNISLDDFRNIIIVENNIHTNYTITQLQGFSNGKNLNIAYNWWFSTNYDTKQMIDKFNNIACSDPSFNVVDNRKFGMDVLRIVKANENYTYLGVYHIMSSSGIFKLCLAGSCDLKKWCLLAELGDDAHQGDIEKWGDGYIVANEKGLSDGNFVQVRFYSSYTNLIYNNPSNNIILKRNFSQFAEGTPDIRSIEGSSPSSSVIVVGFHFWDNRIVDQQGIGILRNFSDWRSWRDDISNYNAKEMGYNGNIGARSSFINSGDFMLMEAQINPNDFSSWRLLFGDGAFYYSLNPKTPLGSMSFGNPGVASIGANEFAVTSFLFTKGNKSGEIGEMLYKVKF